MDVLWNSLGIVCICLSLSMMAFSLYTIIKERKQIRHLLLASGEKMPPWYSYVILRKKNELLFNGALLIMFTVNLMLFQKHVMSATLWMSLPLFLFSCSRLAFTLFEEGGYRAVARETGEDILGWPRTFRFHLGIATAIFWLGISVATLLNGLVSIKVQTFEAMDRFAWIWESLILIGGLYWLIVRAMLKVKKRRARSSSPSSQSPH